MTDDSLVALAQDGDRDAELEIMDKFRPLVKKCCRGYFLIGGDMEDLVQEGMIGLYKAIRSYSPQKNTSFATFASLCVHRQIQSAVRNASTRKNILLSSAVPITDEEDDAYGVFSIIGGKSPDELLISKQTNEEIFSQLKKLLSPNEFVVLKLYLEGISYEQIAAKIGGTKKSVDNALSRIKKKLALMKEKL